MNDLLRVTRALADETRLRILLAMRQQELCICQLIELLQLAPSTVSKQVSILREAGLVQARKDGRWVYCRLASRRGNPLVRRAMDLVLEGAGESLRQAQDGDALNKILSMDPEVLCRKQRPQSV